MTLLAEIVSTSASVGATPSRLTKARSIADLLAKLAPEEVGIAVSYLSGELPQGRIGVGYAALQTAASGGHGPESAGLTVAQADADIAELAAIRGAGSAERRGAALK